MARKHIRTTVDEYRVLLKLNNKWEQVAAYDNLHDANAYIANRNDLYRSEFLKETLKVTKKRVPNPKVHTVYYICDTSPQGTKRIWCKCTSVDDAETKLLAHRQQSKRDTFYVRKQVEYV